VEEAVLSVGDGLRRILKYSLAGTGQIVLQNRLPLLQRKLQGIEEIGLYLHIPFCRQICPYCPYNKEIYRSEVAREYVDALKREIDLYSPLLGRKPVTSFYIGGGTPTTLLHSGLGEVLEHVFRAFNMQCEIHMESHPNDLSRDNLGSITALGVKHLSTGVEALQDRHLENLRRPYTSEQVKRAVERAVAAGFDCFNADLIFALPGQTLREVEQAGSELAELGVDQVAAYPLFGFPYTKLGREGLADGHDNSGLLRRRKMLRILEEIFYGAGYERTSVWAFTRPQIPKYCSVTVPLYLGLGASAGSYLKDVFYLNTFNVSEYICALQNGRLPIALSVELSERMQMAGWLYWRIYETRFTKRDFERRFGRPFDAEYGRYFKPLSWLGLVQENGDEIVLSDEGTYWLHVLEDLFSIDYVGKLWGTSKQDPWPERVAL
jgi:coproporphyrinogen III oxidase-like Fe-S oxidoreductase